MLVLLIHFYKEPCDQTRFLTGKGKNKREIDIGKTYESLGPKHS